MKRVQDSTFDDQSLQVEVHFYRNTHRPQLYSNKQHFIKLLAFKVSFWNSNIAVDHTVDFAASKNRILLTDCTC